MSRISNREFDLRLAMAIGFVVGVMLTSIAWAVGLLVTR